MPHADLPHARIYYEESGSGYPVLALAPGGLDSQAEFWGKKKGGELRKFPDPRPTLAQNFRLITMDQRNTGRSSGDIATDGWHSYAKDHLGLMDHLGIGRFHLIGACIGGPFGFKLLQQAPGRVSAFVVQASTGLHNDNRHLFHKSFNAWRAGLMEREPGADAAKIDQLLKDLYDHDFVFSVSRGFVSQCPTPLLVLAGADAQHPTAISQEVASLSPNARLILDWQGEANGPMYLQAVTEFFQQHTPAAT